LRSTLSKIKVFALDPPGRADTEVTELGRFIGRIPTLHDTIETLRRVLLAVMLEPFRLYEAAAQGRRGLLILAGEIVFADRAADAIEGVERLAHGV